jgi:hypothetical protein
MISREELYELVWSIPMTKVAEKFSVSGSYMARVCSVLNVPRPERGVLGQTGSREGPGSPGIAPSFTRRSIVLVAGG